MRKSSSIAVLLVLCSAAMAAVSVAARDFPQDATVQPQDNLLDPWLPPWLRQIAGPLLPPSPPSPPAGGSSCGLLVPPELCPLFGGSLPLPHLPTPPPAAGGGGGSSCGPLIPAVICNLFSPFLPPATPTPPPPAHR